MPMLNVPTLEEVNEAHRAYTTTIDDKLSAKAALDTAAKSFLGLGGCTLAQIGSAYMAFTTADQINDKAWRNWQAKKAVYDASRLVAEVTK